jgi:hypothetical protein
MENMSARPAVKKVSRRYGGRHIVLGDAAIQHRPFLRLGPAFLTLDLGLELATFANRTVTVAILE